MRTIYSNFANTLLTSILAVMTALLFGCGPGSGATSVTATSAAAVQLIVSSSQLPSDGGTTVDVTAVVLNSSGQAVTGQAVSFSNGGDPSAYFSNVTALTDDNGVVTAKLNVGSNKTNRVITISATAATASGSNTVSVTGTNLSISGNNSLSAGATTDLTISVKDSAGNALSGVIVSATSQSGNGIAFTGASGATTDASGQVVARVTASTAATTDLITVSAAGVSKTQNLIISNSTFAFSAPLANASIPIGVATPVTLNWTSAGVPVAPTLVDFSASRGNLAASQVTTAAGVASTTITGTSTGLSTISATGPGGTPATSVLVNFYTGSASFIAVQANPGTVAVSTSGGGQTGNNSSVISVVVRDAANNLVQNARVNFAITQDVSGGSLSSSTATTDSSGAASVNYIAGTTSSPQNGVIITASVVSITNGGVTTPVTGVSGSVNLTVSGLALLVRLGTDNLVIDGSKLTPPVPSIYQKQYVAFVTDAAMNAKAGVTVSFKLRPRKSSQGPAYAKGFWQVQAVGVPPTNKWVQVVNASCDNEDDGVGGLFPALADNGILDTNIGGVPANTEDFNGDGRLWPSGDATITPTAVTDANGVAIANITYAKDHQSWAVYTVEARTGGLNSNDPPATAPFFFPALADDLKDITIDPPGVISPYGTAAVCTNPL